MVICPNCRSVNEEDRGHCASCGASLDPAIASFGAIRHSPSDRPQIELRVPKQPSRWRPIVFLGFIAVVLVGSGAYAFFRPDPCDGTNFASQNFGYCLLVPLGWEAGPARFGADVTLDQFAPPTESATVVVQAVDLESGTGLDQWSEFVRSQDEDAGLTPGPASDAALDGADALQWDVTVEADGGETFQMREVVTVRDDVGWRVTLNDVQDGFDTSAVVFQDMLESWQFS